MYGTKTGIKLALIGLPLLLCTTAQARTNVLSDPSAIDANKLSADISCEDICETITPDAEWNTSNDQWCANHGSPTEQGVPAEPVAGTAPPSGTNPFQPPTAGTNTPNAEGCRYPVRPEDLRAAGNARAACQYVARRLMHCKFHNSQLASHCLAKKYVGKSNKWQKVLLALDATAAGTCTVACVAEKTGAAITSGVGNAAYQGCKYASTIAGGTEIVAAIFLNSGPLGRAAGGIGGALGIMNMWGEFKHRGPSSYDVARVNRVHSYFLPASVRFMEIYVSWFATPAYANPVYTAADVRGWCANDARTRYGTSARYAEQRQQLEAVCFAQNQSLIGRPVQGSPQQEQARRAQEQQRQREREQQRQRELAQQRQREQEQRNTPAVNAWNSCATHTPGSPNHTACVAAAEARLSNAQPTVQPAALTNSSTSSPPPTTLTNLSGGLRGGLGNGAGVDCRANPLAVACRPVSQGGTQPDPAPVAGTPGSGASGLRQLQLPEFPRTLGGGPGVDCRANPLSVACRPVSQGGTQPDPTPENQPGGGTPGGGTPGGGTPGGGTPGGGTPGGGTPGGGTPGGGTPGGGTPGGGTPGGGTAGGGTAGGGTAGGGTAGGGTAGGLTTAGAPAELPECASGPGGLACREARDAYLADQNMDSAAAYCNAIDGNEAAKSRCMERVQSSEARATQESANDKRGKQACKSAIIFGALTGIRAVSLSQAKKTSEKSCSEIKKLFSDAMVADPNGVQDFNYANGAPSGSGRGGSTGSGSAGGGSGAGTGAGGSGSGLPVANQSFPDGFAQLSPEAMAAVDGQMLSGSGLDKLLSAKASQVDPDELIEAAENGNLAGYLAPGMGGGEIGNAIASLADVAFASPPDTMIDAPRASSMYASGGGGGAQAKPAADSGGGLLSSLGGLFGGKSAGPGAERQIAFDSPQANDIWHTGTDQNIFQIVSDRIGKTTSRWKLPGF